MRNLACSDSEEISQEITNNWVHVSPGLVLGNRERVGVIKSACAFFGGFLLGDTNTKKWGDHQRKKFFINKSAESLIPLGFHLNFLNARGISGLKIWRKQSFRNRVVSFVSVIFFKDLTNRHFYNLAYKLHFLHTDLPMLQKQACSPKTNPPLSIYLECSPTQCVIKKINNAALKFLVYCQQPSSQDLCVNIAHIRSKTFCCVRKYIKFVKVSFQVLIK